MTNGPSLPTPRPTGSPGSGGRESATDDPELAQLRTALVSRTTIGVAIGILMERHGISQDAAFAHLCRLSQAANRKVRDMAADLSNGS